MCAQKASIGHNIIILYGALAGMENEYRLPMDQYQNIAILYIY